MNDYCKGAWEALNFVIKLMKTYDFDRALKIIEDVKNTLEENVAVDFRAKIEGFVLQSR